MGQATSIEPPVSPQLKRGFHVSAHRHSAAPLTHLLQEKGTKNKFMACFFSQSSFPWASCLPSCRTISGSSSSPSGGPKQMALLHQDLWEGFGSNRTVSAFITLHCCKTVCGLAARRLQALTALQLYHTGLCESRHLSQPAGLGSRVTGCCAAGTCVRAEPRHSNALLSAHLKSLPSSSARTRAGPRVPGTSHDPQSPNCHTASTTLLG